MILGVGTLTPVKGFDRLVAAFPAILASHPDAQLFLIGPGGSFAGGDESRPLRVLIERLSLEGKVHLAGEVENRDLVTWYNVADCFCLPSRSEGCPNVVLEALACGCPAVATDVGAVSELIADPKVGIVVENSEKGIQAGLITALSRDYDRREIASYVERFSWDRCAESLLEIYGRFVPHSWRVSRIESSSSQPHCVEERAESL